MRSESEKKFEVRRVVRDIQVCVEGLLLASIAIAGKAV